MMVQIPLKIVTVFELVQLLNRAGLELWNLNLNEAEFILLFTQWGPILVLEFVTCVFLFSITHLSGLVHRKTCSKTWESPD